MKTTTCPVCGGKVRIRNDHVTYWMRLLGKRPMCKRCIRENGTEYSRKKTSKSWWGLGS